MKEEYVKGWQYHPDTMFFTGEYSFPKNQDSDVLHIPPFTVLKPPPKRKIKEGNEWQWDGESWRSVKWYDKIEEEGGDTLPSECEENSI